MQDILRHISGNLYFLLAMTLIGATCGLLSTYIVLRRMSLLSEGISHAAFGGIALAILLGYYFPIFENFALQRITTGVFCLLTALLIGFVARNKRVPSDAAIGILLVATLALGDLLLNIRYSLPHLTGGRSNFVPNAEGLLFGEPLSANASDVWVLGGTALVVFAIVGALYYQFLYTTLDEEMARINGVKTRAVNLLLLMMITLVIVICVQIVGALMITALTIIPGATANMISRHFTGVLVLSLFIGTLGTGLAATMAVNRPFSQYIPGPIIVLALFALFAVVWLYRYFFKPKPQSLEPETPAPYQHAGHSH